MHCYKLCQKPAVLFCCLYFAISAGQKIQKKTCSNLSSQKSSSFSLPQKEGTAIDNKNKNDTAENGNDDINPDTFSIFKYFGYGVDLTRHSLASDDPARNFTTNLLEPLFRFRPSKNIWRNLTLPNIIWDTVFKTDTNLVDPYVLDIWENNKESGVVWLTNHDEIYRKFPANFSSLYLTANHQERVAAQVIPPFSVEIIFIYKFLQIFLPCFGTDIPHLSPNDKFSKQTLVLHIYLNTFVKINDVSLLSKKLVKEATALAHLPFDGTTRPLFYAFFRRFGTHFNYQLHFGRLTHIRTLLEIDFYQKYGKTKMKSILKKYAINATDDTIPAEFHKRSRSVAHHFGRGNGEGDHFRSLVPVFADVLLIHDLLRETKVVPNTEAMELALKTYLFEYQLRSIRDVLIAFKGDFRSELCFQERPKAGDNLRLTEEYLAMKPFPDRGSLWDNSTEPGGYRKSVAWHLAYCVPANRDQNNLNPDIFSVFKYFAYGIDVTQHSLTSDDPERNFTTNLLDPLFRFRPGWQVWNNLTLPDYIYERVSESIFEWTNITILNTWWNTVSGSLFLLYDHMGTSAQFSGNFSQLYQLANHNGMVAIQVRAAFAFILTKTIQKNDY